LAPKFKVVGGGGGRTDRQHGGLTFLFKESNTTSR
jgi:hypothetical protein